jgi:DNA-binding response OmpR family regulator
MSEINSVNPPHRGLALVVDDDEDSQLFVVLSLKKLGYEVKTAADGMAALHMCESEVFDLVVCDIRMPKLSGISFIKNVRARSPNSAKRIIFVSSMDDVMIKREAFEAGAEDYLVKPISSAILAKAITGLSA